MNQSQKEKVAGILGGMGPEATVDLMQRIIRLTPAEDDKDHIRCIVDNNPKIPSRIKAIIEGTGESPVPCLIETARGLEAYGADFIAIPCNTAHYYFQEIQAAVGVPVIHMIQLVVERVISRRPGLSRAGILATPAVRITRLYENLLSAQGIDAVYPSPFEQERLFALVKDIKTGRKGPLERAGFKEILEDIATQGAEIGIIACTELGVICGEESILPLFDAAEILAEEIVAVVKQGKPLVSLSRQ